MLRPERMTSASIICLRRDLGHALEALNGFGEFHVEMAAEEQSQKEYAKALSEVESTFADLEKLIGQFGFENSGFTDLFRSQTPLKMYVTAENWQWIALNVMDEASKLKQEAQSLIALLAALQEKTSKHQQVKSTLNIMEAIKADFSVMEELRFIRVAVAIAPTKNINDLKKALAGVPMVLHKCYLSKKTVFICMAMPSKYASDVEKTLKSYHGELFELPEGLPHDIPKAIALLERQIAQNIREADSIKKKLTDFAESNKLRLLSLRETSQNAIALLRVEQGTLQTARLATIKGFVPQKKLSALKEKMSIVLKGSVLVLEEKPVPAADPPTKLSNNRFIKPFEEITKLYGVPHYDELDPTIFIAVSFPLIFGLMFGDIGHGLVLLVGGLMLGFLIKKNSTLKNIGWILAACGLGAVFAGFLFGEAFGVKPFAPLWFSPFNDVLTFLIFSLFVGVAQIVSGIVLEMVNFALGRNVMDVVLTSVPKLAFYLGSVYLVAAYQLNFEAWLRGPVLFAVIPLLVLMLGKSAVGRVSGLLWSSSGGSSNPSFVERVFESGELVTRLLSNTVSYARILALLMAHWALVTATYAIAGLANSGSVLSWAFAAVVVVLGNVFVIALEGLIVFIHSLRLHFYEWFSKFYAGTGTEFRPYKQNFVYTEVVLQEKTA